MRRLVTYFPESNTAPVERWQTEISESEIEELKRIACEYQNKHIYINSCGNLCINYGRFQNEIINGPQKERRE